MKSKPVNAAELKDQAAAAARWLKAIANENRLQILCMLIEGEASVGELNERIALSQSALSQHLAVLRRDDLVATRRESQTVYYRLAEKEVRDLIGILHGRFCRRGSKAAG